MKRCSSCGLNFMDHLKTCPECGKALRDRITAGGLDGIRFLATLQHLPADIAGQYHGGVILSNIRDHLGKADQVHLSQLACEEKTIQVILQAVE